MNEKDIQERVNRRLSGLCADEARRMRIRTAMRAERQANEIVKKKISPVLIAALVLVLLTATAAIAEHLNLFDFFGSGDQRYANVAQQAELSTSAPVTVTNAPQGVASAALDSAYFDGLTLNLAFRIEQGVRFEAYTPSAEELAGMTGEPPMPEAVADEYAPGSEVLAAYQQALANGTPFGYRAYQVSPSDHTLTDDGVEIPPYAADGAYTADGAYAELREFETPLPAELASREALNLRIKLYRSTTTVYFDGQQVYRRTERAEAGELTGTVPLTKDAVRELSGEATINGASCRAEAKVSRMAASVTFQCDAPFRTFLAAPPEGIDPSDAWVEFAAYDEAGRRYRVQSAFDLADDQAEYTVAFLGVGELPETLTLYVFAAWDGPSLSAEDIQAMTGIPLTIRKN